MTRKIYPPKFDEQHYYVKEFYYHSGGDTQHLVNLLKTTNVELTDKTRCFIADVLAGTAKKTGKKRKNFTRDWQVYCLINNLLELNENLTSNGNKDGAAAKAADVFDISEDSAVKIYQRMSLKYHKKPFNREDYL